MKGRHVRDQHVLFRGTRGTCPKGTYFVSAREIDVPEMKDINCAESTGHHALIAQQYTMNRVASRRGDDAHTQG